jgi:glutaredoxin
MEKIKIYSIPECGHCNRFKELLTEKGYKFTDINANLPENEAEYLEIYEACGVDSVPVIRIENELLVPTKSFETIDEAVLRTIELYNQYYS